MVSAPDQHTDAGQHMGGGIDAGHGFPYGLAFRRFAERWARVRRPGCSHRGGSLSMRALRIVPECLPHVRRDAAGNGVAARPDRADEGGTRGAHRHQRAVGVALGIVPAVPRMRGGVSVGRALRAADGTHAGAGSRQQPAKSRIEPPVPTLPAGCITPQQEIATGRSSDAPVSAVRIAAVGPQVRPARFFAGGSCRDGSADAGHG